MERYTPRERASEARHALPQAAANMSAHAYGILSGMIMRRELRGGDKLVEQRLAEQLQISRTPLREAMQRLEGEGLIRKGATRSYVVRVVEMREYLQSLRVRKVLEAEAAALAAGKVGPEEIARVREVVLALERMVPYNTQAHWACDDEVHNLFIDACGNGVMAAILRDMRVTTRLFEIAQLAERLGPDSASISRSSMRSRPAIPRRRARRWPRMPSHFSISRSERSARLTGGPHSLPAPHPEIRPVPLGRARPGQAGG